MPDLEALLRELERVADPAAREKARAVVRATLDLHAAGLERLAAAVRRLGGTDALVEVARDPGVASVLALHGLHPVDAETRVRRALDATSGALRTRGASAEVSVDGGLRVRVLETGPASSGAASLVEAAVCEAAPDVDVLVERVGAADLQGFVPIERLQSRSAAEAVEQCELCGAAVGPGHDHLVGATSRELRCACTACALLFARGEPGEARWTRVPRRAERIAGFSFTDADWAALALPIDLAFFYRSRRQGRLVAMYPGPAGATESSLALDAMSSLEAQHALLRELAPEVEAILVRKAAGAREHYRVSIDACYALVGHIRKHWRGLSGGREVREQIGAFFDGLVQPAARAGARS